MPTKERETLAELFVTTNRVSLGLAQHWVKEMSDTEVADELKLRSKIGGVQGA